MRRHLAIAVLLGLVMSPARAADIAAGDTLRAVYLGGNPAQAMGDPATGNVRGASATLARELAARHGLKLEFRPLNGPPDVIEAVRGGQADIGFVAYEVTRLGTVEFSQTYMLVRQSFLVPDNSSITTVADVDRPGLKIGGLRNDSITLCMQRIFKQATVVQFDNRVEGIRQLTAGELNGFAANRQTLTTLSRAFPGTRLLADDLFHVPQTIIVPKDKPAALAAVNAFFDQARASGLLQTAIEQGGAIGVLMAPHGEDRYGCPG